MQACDICPDPLSENTRAGYRYVLCGLDRSSDVPLTTFRPPRGWETIWMSKSKLCLENLPIARDAGRLVVHKSDYSLIRMPQIADFAVVAGKQFTYGQMLVRRVRTSKLFFLDQRGQLYAINVDCFRFMPVR